MEISTEEKDELQSLQVQCDDKYREKANGAFWSSKARLIEQGEKNTSYFYELEKHRQSKKRISKLKKNDNDQLLSRALVLKGWEKGNTVGFSFSAKS